MRRAVLVSLTAAMLAVLLVSTAAFAAQRSVKDDGVVVGSSEADELSGSDGNDTIKGGPGHDMISGGPGSDRLVGGSGEDVIVDSAQDGVSDLVVGGGGNDAIDVVSEPAFKDVVRCGAGEDLVLADARDVVSEDCEQVDRTAAPSATPVMEFGEPLAQAPGVSPRAPAELDPPPYRIRNYYATRFDGSVPLRWGIHRGPGSGFGWRHIEFQRGWGYGVRYSLFRTLRFGRVEVRSGTRVRMASQGPRGCVWRAQFDNRILTDSEKFGIVTFYSDRNNPACPDYQG